MSVVMAYGCLRIWPITAIDAPARSNFVANEWRSRWEPLKAGLRAARERARRTTLQIATELENPSWGADRRMNTLREEHRGRPLRRYWAKALPTALGSGSRTSRRDLPMMTGSPASQSISSNVI